MLGQMVAAGEALGAERAGEALLARVRPVVAGQLVGAREFLVTPWPVTGEGPFTCTGTNKRSVEAEGQGELQFHPEGSPRRTQTFVPTSFWVPAFDLWTCALSYAPALYFFRGEGVLPKSLNCPG